MSKKYAVSLNENNPEDRPLIDLLDQPGTYPSATIKAALTAYLYQEQPIEAQDNTEILEEIRAGFAVLADKIDNMNRDRRKAAVIPPSEQEQELTENGLQLSELFVTAVKKAARPGVRLDEVKQ